MKKLIGGYFKPYYHYHYKKGVLARGAGRTAYVTVVLLCALASAGVGFLQTQKPAAAAAKSSSYLQPMPKKTNQLSLVSSTNLPISQSAKLQDVITQFVNTHQTNRWAVSVQGLDTLSNTSASYNDNSAFGSASVFKLLLIYPLSQKVPFEKWATTNLSVDGKNRSLQTCVDAMLRVSDNDCGDAVGNYVGWGHATSQLQKLGLSRTNLNNPNGPTTTSADASAYVQLLATNRLLDAATTQFVMNILTNQIYRAGIPAGCPGCVVADKTGDLGTVRNDVGLVNFADGSYVLAIFTNGASYSQIAQLTSQIQAVLAGS